VVNVSHLYIVICNEKLIELLGSPNVKTRVISREVSLKWETFNDYPLDVEIHQ
jgi:hypothetical protein